MSTATTTKPQTVKQLERQADQLTAKRDKERTALAETEGKLADTLKALAEARKTEGGNGSNGGAKKRPANSTSAARAEREQTAEATEAAGAEE